MKHKVDTQSIPPQENGTTVPLGPHAQNHSWTGGTNMEGLQAAEADDRGFRRVQQEKPF